MGCRTRTLLLGAGTLGAGMLLGTGEARAATTLLWSGGAWFVTGHRVLIY